MRTEQEETENQKVDIRATEDEESSIDSTLIIINVIALVLFLIIATTRYAKVGLFCFFICVLISGGVAEPLVLVLSNKKTKDKFNIKFHRVVLVVAVVYVIISLYTLYKVVFTYPIIEDKMYWLYYLMFVLLIPYTVILKYNHLLGKKDEICKDEKSKIKRAFLMSGNLTYLISGIIVFFVLNYRSHNIIDLAKIKTPEEISVVHVDHEATINNKSKEKEKLNIQDVEVLFKEISKYKVKNLRYLDEFNYFINFEKLKDYHVFYLYYKDKEDGRFISDKNKRMKIQYIEVYRDELIIYAVPVNRKIFDKMNEKYRLKLPREIIESLINKIDKDE